MGELRIPKVQQMMTVNLHTIWHVLDPMKIDPMKTISSLINGMKMDFSKLSMLETVDDESLAAS
eukprot:3208403-Pleurochrysis_carterae.AAC.1